MRESHLFGTKDGPIDLAIVETGLQSDLRAHTRMIFHGVVSIAYSKTDSSFQLSRHCVRSVWTCHSQQYLPLSGPTMTGGCHGQQRPPESESAIYPDLQDYHKCLGGWHYAAQVYSTCFFLSSPAFQRLEALLMVRSTFWAVEPDFLFPYDQLYQVRRKQYRLHGC